MAILKLTELPTEASHDFSPKRLIIAGFTIRDKRTLEHHLNELRGLGATVPDVMPTFLELDIDLLTTDGEIQVDGANTSGEVEPVLIMHDGRLFISVGSDHTDRELERFDIATSKRKCPKIISRHMVLLDSIEKPEDLTIASWCDSDQREYQVGTVANLLPISQILSLFTETYSELRNGDVMFLGTLPTVRGELIASPSFRVEMKDPNSGIRLQSRYSVTQGDVVGPEG